MCGGDVAHALVAVLKEQVAVVVVVKVLDEFDHVLVLE